ncbi:polysaccharide lyase family 8 super-sandwich domain-containing protein [Streptomyces beihaiensis]|uniref:DNRLRE domain-containing protein n=1 Tax=Streptomyces beihaiensis TaxID=2984495 RepID=A0ABT3TX11_9ACTN|nr:polysaccharide lyase family 8 super-sandwich domain-containing protein [Streptomyces beihaiensis]MCX3061584.1 DNRLRE domain-containing protein [Streptomyces beihaiensis]
MNAAGHHRGHGQEHSPSPRPLSRRRLLQLGASGTALAAAAPWLLPSAEAWAADTYDGMRATWLRLLTGSGFDAASAPFSTALATLGSEASTYQNSMSASGTSSLWSDLPIGSVSAHMTASYTRLRTMALAYVQPGTGLTGDSTLRSDIVTGLDWMSANAYRPAGTTYDNWWDWQIGSPEALLDLCTLVYSQLTSSQIGTCTAAIDTYVPDSAVSSYDGTSTGANRVDLCRVLALRGVIGKDSAKIATARTALSPVFPYVITGDGLYADGSFVQHTYVPYTGGYGVVLIDGLSKLLTLLAGTTWAITDPAVQNLFSAVTDSYAPFLYNGLVMDGVSGRGISRGYWRTTNAYLESDQTRGHGLVAAVLRLAESGAPSSAQAGTWKSMVKGWIQRDYYLSYLDDVSLGIPELARAQAVLDDSTVSAAPEPVGSQVFGMDRAVHRRPGWAAQISMCSSRTTFYEHGNGENLKGWHQNSGMLYWYGDTYGNGQYSDHFWPTVDPYRLPGTTVSTLALADAAGGAWGGSHPDATWAGGATDGTYSAVGQDVRGLNSTLAGKKSWFCLDDSIMCLGAGITSSDGTTVQTTVDNRNLGANNHQDFTVDGTVQPSTLGWSHTFTGCGYMAINGMGAWVFPGGATVDVKREARTAAWSDINTNSSTTPYTRNYVTMWFDHGTDPADADYSYLLMPGATPAQAAARAASPTATVLSNTATVQAVTDSSAGLTMANFFAAGTAGPITVSAPCSVLVKESGGTMTVAVADPSRASSTVEVTVARSGYAAVTDTSGVTVLSTSGAVRLLAEVGGTRGASRTATLTTSGSAVSRTASLLPATAAAYVRDGSYATDNYGDLATLVVKNVNSSGSGYDRQSLLKFDVSGLTGTVSRAILWAYGNVEDSGGDQTTVQAFALTSDGWSETGVTWNTRPALGAALGTGMVSTAYDWVGLDVTSAVAAAMPSAGGDGTVALAIWEPLNKAGLATILHGRAAGGNTPVLEAITT